MPIEREPALQIINDQPAASEQGFLQKIRQSAAARSGVLASATVLGIGVAAHQAEAANTRPESILEAETNNTSESLGSLALTGDVTETAQTIRSEQIKRIKERIPRTYRCDGENGEPVPGWRFCPKMRGLDVVPKGGWKVAPKSFAHRFISARKQVFDQSLRKPISTEGMRYGPYGPKLSFYLPYHPQTGFAKPQSFHFSASENARWEQIHACEGPWNYQGFYDGGLQMDTPFQNNYASDIIQAYWKYLGKRVTVGNMTPTEQKIIGQRGQLVQGWGAWPVCQYSR